MKKRTPAQYKALVRLADFYADYKKIERVGRTQDFERYYNKYPGARRWFNQYTVTALLAVILDDINNNNLDSAWVKGIYKD